jgi:serine protease Do
VHVQNVTGEIAKSMGLQEPVGALVASVAPGGPAAAAGLKPSDVILKFDGQPVETMRSLPKAVASTPIGKAVDVEVQRSGEVIHLTVTVGRLPEEAEEAEEAEAETESTTEAEPGPDAEEQEEEPDHEELLGLSIAPLTEELRSQFRIGKSVEGVVITDVEANSPAAKKDVKPGDVIVEVTQERVTDPGEVVARVAAVKKSGRKSVLLLISDSKGGLRFVAVPVA